MQHPGTGENIWTGNIYFFMVSILLNINYFWYNKGFRTTISPYRGFRTDSHVINGTLSLSLCALSLALSLSLSVNLSARSLSSARSLALSLCSLSLALSLCALSLSLSLALSLRSPK